MGETIVSTRRLTGIDLIGADRVRVGAGVTLEALNRALESAGRLYPPSPTFSGAFIGGTVATNAAGAATFKYGTTRDWVEAITVVLPSGDVLDIERGATRATSDGRFELELASGPTRVPVPTYQMPQVAKLSAGYFAAPGMDLIDLFIGSEGTLGIVTAVTLRVLAVRPAMCAALVPLSTETAALTLARSLRDAARETWRTRNPRGVDVAAIEYMDARSLSIAREDRADVVNHVRLPPGAGAALLVTLELPAGTDAAAAFDQIGRARDANRPDTPLVKFCGLLADCWRVRRCGDCRPGRRGTDGAARRRSRGRPGGSQPAGRPGEARRGRRDRKGRGRRGRAVRSARGTARRGARARVPPRPRPRRLGPCVGRQPAPQPDRADAGTVAGGGRSGGRPRTDGDSRSAARRWRSTAWAAT